MIYEEVYGKFLSGDGSPLSGSVVFTPAFSFARDEKTMALPAPVVAHLDSAGRVTSSLMVPGDGVEPTAWTWHAKPILRHKGALVEFDSFNFELFSGRPVNLATVAPVPSMTGDYKTVPTGDSGVGIKAITTEGGELVFKLSDGSTSRVALPKSEFDASALDGLATLEEVDRRIGAIDIPKVEGLATLDEVDKRIGAIEIPRPVEVDVEGRAKAALGPAIADVERKLSQIAVDTSPFVSGSRYYSPVTYYWPDFYRETSQWSKVLRFGGDLGIVILNRNSGDWEKFDQDFLTQGRLAKGAGARRVIFYVKTQYAAAGNPAEWGKDVPNAEKFTKEHILKQLEYCHTHYPDIFDGVFLDEVINGWGDQAVRVPWYKDLIDAIRVKYGPQFLIVANNGSNVSEEVLKLDADVFMTFESTAEVYLKDDPKTPVHPAHMAAQPGNRFWHVVHDVTPENYLEVFAKAEKLGIGHLYITDGKLVMGEGGQWEPEVNPYAVAPSQWITDVITPWLRGILDTRLKTEKLETRVTTLEEAEPPKVAASDVAELVTGDTEVKAELDRVYRRGYSVKAFGAVGDGKADDTAAIQAAADAAYSASPNSTLHFPEGRYKITDTITVRCGIDGKNGQLDYTGTGTALIVGSTAGQVTSRIQVYLPRIVNQAATKAAAFDGTSIGARLINLNGCIISFDFIQNFETGLVCEGLGQGFVHNTLTVGSLWNNHVNLSLRPVTLSGVDGWVNSNLFLGGRFTSDARWGSKGDESACYIEMQPSTGGPGPNGNTFINTSIEGPDLQKYRFKFTGRHNHLLNLRWEHPTSDVLRILWGAHAYYNRITGGYNLSRVQEDWDANSGFNTMVFDDSPMDARSFNVVAADVPHDTLTVVGWNTFNGHKTTCVDGVITPRPGRWQIDASVMVQPVTVAGYAEIQLVDDKNVMLAATRVVPTSTQLITLRVSARHTFTPGGNVRVMVKQNSGSPMRIVGSARYSQVTLEALN